MFYTEKMLISFYFYLLFFMRFAAIIAFSIMKKLILICTFSFAFIQIINPQQIISRNSNSDHELYAQNIGKILFLHYSIIFLIDVHTSSSSLRSGRIEYLSPNRKPKPSLRNLGKICRWV